MSRGPLLISFVVLLLAVTIFASLKPDSYGLDHVDLMEPFLGGQFPSDAPTGNVPWTFREAFPNLHLSEPTCMIEIPGTNKFLISGKRGEIWIIDNDSTTSTAKLLLDMRDSVMGQSDAGLLDIALHPEFANPDSPHRGELYAFYTYTPDTTLIRPMYDRLVRFHISEALDTINPASQEILIQQFDHQEWHNGGCIFFDKDHYLYMTVGDEGGIYDEYNNTQKINKSLFSGLLRIDVDLDSSRSHPIRRFPVPPTDRPAGWPDNINQHYMIPNDNPWVNADGKYLEEFFAIGLRSPHRAYYDSLTGKIWVADVGQHNREEISLIKKGSNAQWAYREGKLLDLPQLKPKPDSLIGIETPPVIDYGRQAGNAVIAGFVYHGQKHPALNGLFIFGDFVFDNVWSLNPDNNEVVLLGTLPDTPGRGLVTFSTDANGEIYVIKIDGNNAGAGTIYKLSALKVVPDPPALLSQTGAFKSLETLEPADGIVPFDVNTPLWSDGATKRRWISLPKGTKIDFFANSEWAFPKGTVFIKEFELPTSANSVKRIEIRFLVVAENGGVYGVTYQWNDEGTEAYLISRDDEVSKEIEYTDDNDEVQNQEWYFPTRGQCLTCHNSNAGFVLGGRSAQYNRTIVYPSTGIEDNQIRTWNHLGFFSKPIDESTIGQLPKLVPLNDPNASDELKVRSYLDANCAFCHRPNGVDAAFDARFRIPLKDQHLINTPVIGRNSTPGNFIVKPKDLAHSELWIRDDSLGEIAMPPLAKHKLDQAYLSTLAAWILSIDTTSTDTTKVVEGLPPVLVDEPQISVVVYPNPSRELCAVKVSVSKKTFNNLVIRIFDTSGRIVYQNYDVPPDTELRVESSNWAPGLYIIQSSIGTVRAQTRVVKL